MPPKKICEGIINNKGWIKNMYETKWHLKTKF